MSDSFSAFKLHSNIPNSTINSPSAPEITTISSLTQPYCFCAHCTHLFTFNIHHLGYVGEQGGTSSGGSQQSSRWSPTPAQLLYLEELYRQGTKTPTAEQIQQIASQLRRFGKIEGKNVFYWFQNHKARERQKRRRCETEISASSAQEKDLYVKGLSSEKHLEQEAYQGLRGTAYEVKETKKWASPSNCSGLAEVSASLDIAERVANRWIQSEEREMQILRSKRGERQETKCQNREMSCFPSNSNRTKKITISTTTHTQTSNPPNYYDEEIADTRTLKLFPHKRDEDGICLTEMKDKFCAITAAMNSEIISNQFFEFLPLRN